MLYRKNPILLFFTIIILCEIYLPSYKANFFIQLFFLIFLLIDTSKIKLLLFKNISPLILIFLIGFIGTIGKGYPTEFIIKDIIYFLKPINAILLSYLAFTKVNNTKSVLVFFINIGLLTALVHLLGVVFFSNFFNSSISDLRGDHGLDNFIEIFSFYFLLYYKKWFGERLIKNKIKLYFLLGILLFSISIYFSRTMLIVFLLGIISLEGYTRLTKRSIQFILVSFVLIIALYGYLYSIRIDRNSKGIEAFLYKIKIAPEEVFDAKIDRENHKDLWDHWRAYEAKRALHLMEDYPSSYIYGTGYGSLVNLKFSAPLGEGDMKHISRLHNGYVFVFYKTGIIGLFLMLLFLFNIYNVTNKKAEKNNYIKNRFISYIGLFFIFSTLIISGIYIPKDIIIFVLGGLILKD